MIESARKRQVSVAVGGRPSLEPAACVGFDGICDGRTVYKQKWSEFGVNAKASGWHPSRLVAPGDLLSATGQSVLPQSLNLTAMVFPDRFSHLGWKYEFDPRPADAPGCVVYKLSASLATAEPQVGHEWYYIDPRKGYAVVRAELFSLPANAPAANPESTRSRSSLVMDGFRQSPRGFWYPTVIRETDVEADRIDRHNSAEKPTQTTQTIRYHFDFNAPLPDSLFEVDGNRDPKKEPGRKLDRP